MGFFGKKTPPAAPPPAVPFDAKIPEETGYDAAVAARDAAAGVTRPASAPANAAADAAALGWLTVLLDEPPPQGQTALASWAKEAGLERAGVRVTTYPDLELGFGTQTFQTFVGRAPYPTELADFGRVGDDFPVGGGFIAIAFGLTSMAKDARAAGIDRTDKLAADGLARHAARIAAALLEGLPSSGVIVNRAAQTVFHAEEFLRMIGDLADPECRPFLSFVDFGTSQQDGMYRSFGMEVFALPDVGTRVDVSDRFELRRATEALELACYRMTREARWLAEGETLDVPPGLAVGAYELPEDLAADGDALRWIASGTDPVVLAPAPGQVPLAARWAVASDRANPDPERIGSSSYGALAVDALDRAFPGHSIAGITPRPEERVPPFRVDVRTRHDGEGFLTVSVGLGRVPQPGGDVDAGTRHVELGIASESHGPAVASVIVLLAGDLHTHAADPAHVWKPGDTLRLEHPALGNAGFLLADGGALPMRGGAPVRLLLLVPLSAEEYDEVRAGGSAAWLAPRIADAAGREELRRRWDPLAPPDDAA